MNTTITINRDELLQEMKDQLLMIKANKLAKADYWIGYHEGKFSALRMYYILAGGDINKVEYLRKEVLGE